MENSLYFTDKYQSLRIYTKPVRFVYGKISCMNPLVKRMKQRVRLVDYKEKEKKRPKQWAQAMGDDSQIWLLRRTKPEPEPMTNYLKARVNMLTLGMTCTSLLIAHALLHSGACCPGRRGGI